MEQFEVLRAFIADGEAFDGLLAGLTDEQWARPTPAPGWTIAHQVGHLSSNYRLGALSCLDPEAFAAAAAAIGHTFDGAYDAADVAGPPKALFERFQTDKADFHRGLGIVGPDGMVPWLGGLLPAGVFAAGGMMEMFAHGQDIADALGITQRRTDRLVHVVQFAVIMRDAAYTVRGLPVPEEPFRYELTAPSGALWTFGPDDATQRITGPAVDFCLLATRRRHHADVAVTATGETATQWLEIAQAYVADAGPGRRPGQFATV